MSASRAVQVLRALASSSVPLPAAAVAASVGAPRASTYRVLRAMAAEGFVTHLPEEGRWTLGLATFEVGSAYLRRQPLERLALPLLLRLVGRTRRTAHLGILHGAETLYLLVERPRRPAPLVTAVGVRLPAHLTASGRALLAQHDEGHVRALYPRGLVSRGGPGPQDVDELLAQLVVERRRGWSSEEGLVTAGWSSVAAAARDSQGRPAAAISLTQPAGEPALVTDVLTAAGELSRRLGTPATRSDSP